jgi:hypothetical protein
MLGMGWWKGFGGDLRDYDGIKTKYLLTAVLGHSDEGLSNPTLMVLPGVSPEIFI